MTTEYFPAKTAMAAKSIGVPENACATTHIHDDCILQQSWIRNNGISISVRSNLHKI
jgi:hypothetical protein